MLETKANTDIRPGSDRSFGVVFGVVFALLGLWPLLSGAPPRMILLGLAAALLFIAAVRPALFRHPNRLWHRFGLLLGAVVAPVVMTLVYVATILPIGLAMRLMGRDLLNAKIDRSRASYWVPRSMPPGSMKNQF